MKYGDFDDERREYVICRPDTPLPWINYLGNDDFYGIISNTGGGYCFYQDSRLRRLTRYRYNNIPMDSNGRYVYIRDGNTVWNPMWKPMQVTLDSYQCRHGLGYTIIAGQKNGLEAIITYFIPNQSRVEVWDVKIRNLTEVVKSVRLWGFVEWCLWDAYDDMTNFQRNYSTGEVEIEDNAIFHVTEYRERRNHYAYFASSFPTSGYDTSRDAFVGLHNGLHAAQAVLAGECTNSHAYGWLPLGVHQVDLTLAPNEEKCFHFLLGYDENPHNEKFVAPKIANKAGFRKVYERFAQPGAVTSAFEDLRDYWTNTLSTFQAQTAEATVNSMVNVWNQYQCMVTFNMSRSTSLYESGIGRGMGFRDSNQDVLGFVHMIPERARQRILDIAATQLSDGTCYHQYQPLTKKGNALLGSGFNDDPLWLILSTSAYLRETGDFSILDAKIGFADLEDGQATLMDHVEISIKYTLENRGPHGLPLIGHADWNDCLNLNCYSSVPGESFQLTNDKGDGKTAESIMIAGLFCRACKELAGIYAELGQHDKAEETRSAAQEMTAAVMQHGWDGEWFLRAYDAKGREIGSSENAEGKIFVESQGWCIYGGIGLTDGAAEKALASVKKYLATPDGIILQQPAYQTYHLALGEISSYPPGYKENAGIFTHNNTWIQIAETMVGNGDRAFEYYMSICPANKQSQIDTYRSEPYAYSQMTASRDAPTPGEAKNSWLSGTAAWSFVVISQYILGIQPEFQGLRINPCLPRKWTEVSVIRRFRGACYEIVVKNPHGRNKGVKNIIVDGRELAGNIVPIFGDGLTHTVLVTMGKE